MVRTIQEQYYAVVRTGSNDELQHWKYIKKKKVNGKWRYYYDKSQLDKFKYGDKETKVTRKGESYTTYGTLTKTTKTYKKSKSLFDKKSIKEERPHNPKRSLGRTWSVVNKKVEYKQGKLSRLQAKAEKWVYNTFIKQKNKPKTNDKNLIQKSKKFIGNLLSKTVKDIGKPKYIAKVKTPNGRTRYFYSQDEYNAYNNRLKYQKNEPDFLKHVKKIDKNKIMSADEDMEATNPKYKTQSYDYTNNCFKCVMTYEMRRRGYDVEANKANVEEQKLSDIKTMFKNPKTYIIGDDGEVTDINKKKSSLLYTTKRLFSKDKQENPDTDTVRKTILKHSKKNSRGILVCNWNRGGAHAMAYEVNNKGKVTVRDPQTNDVYDLDEVTSRSYDITFTRLDNLEMKKRVLKNVK